MFPTPTITTPQHRNPSTMPKRPRLPSTSPSRKSSCLQSSSKANSWSREPIMLLPDAQKRSPRLRRLRNLRCQFLSILSIGQLCTVLLVSHRGEKRVLKIYIPPPTHQHRDAFKHEYYAYATLMSAVVKHASPHCYFALTLSVSELAHALTLSVIPHELSHLQQHHTSLQALLIEYIPCSVTLETYFKQPRCDPAVVGLAADALDKVHAAGVLHLDVEPRNALLMDSGKVCWIDFDVAKTTDQWCIPEEYWIEEKARVRWRLEEIGSERVGLSEQETDIQTRQDVVANVDVGVEVAGKAIC
ncbi:hypothetical protein BDD12DRAFT_855158 [Trichophaea hybrida]|nr:hypothetical protein BDD12DRAFT_855158 [Trichophaea hybrida]